MKKDEINRSDLKKNIMRNIILRIDFQGVLDIEEFIKKIRAEDLRIFSNFDKKEEYKLNLKFRPNLSSVKEMLDLSDEEILSQKVFEFYENKLLSGQVYLYIGAYYMMLVVDCSEEYKNINSYVDYFSALIKKLILKNKFISLKRFGIRKISYDYFYSLESLFEVFEEKSNIKNLINETISRNLKGIKNESNINYFRKIEDGLLTNEAGEEIYGYKGTLDFDAYYGPEYLRENWKSLISKIDEDIYKLNDDLFEVFKESVTKDFLNKNV